MDGAMTTWIALGCTLVAALSTVALVLWMVDRSNKKYQSKRIDVEYQRLCQDPRYKVR
jgi:hypothetical protein